MHEGVIAAKYIAGPSERASRFTLRRSEQRASERAQRARLYVWAKYGSSVCEGFNKSPGQPSPVVVFVGLTLIAALFLLAFFVKSAFVCSLRFIKNTKNNLRKNAFLLKSTSTNADENR